jgi:hypothetical protein
MIMMCSPAAPDEPGRMMQAVRMVPAGRGGRSRVPRRPASRAARRQAGRGHLHERGAGDTHTNHRGAAAAAALASEAAGLT